MKGRSHRLPTSAAPMDDWLDGSWTVDCPCGVTFDDGEEMVKCDECGVWVHTRCTRFVKEEASFTCDKCKGSRVDRGEDGFRSAAVPAFTNIEETEVAQLLVELPTKADPCPPPTYQRTGFRRWAELPMEEKVHVQGVPGGDPTLFAGLSTVFSGELWKCTGYVPKKFNFKYKEFPCWDNDESDNPASAGADLLFSLSKETIASVTSEAVERLQSPAGMKISSGKDMLSGSGNSFTKKGRSKFRGLGFHSSKQREGDSTGSKERSVKKMKIAGSSDKNRDTKHVGSAHRVDGRNSVLIDKGIARRLNIEMENMTCEDKRVEKPPGPTSDIHSEGKNIKDDMKNTVSVKSPSGVPASVASRLKLASEVQVKEDKVQVESSSCNGNPSKTEDSAKSAGPSNLIAETFSKKDADANVPNRRSNNDCSDFRIPKHAPSGSEVERGLLEQNIGDFCGGSQPLPPSALLDSSCESSNGTLKVKKKEDTVSGVAQVNECPKICAPVTGGLEGQNLPVEHVYEPDESLPKDTKSHEILSDLAYGAIKLQLDEKELASQAVCGQSAGIISEPSDTMKLVPERELTRGLDKIVDNVAEEHKLSVAVGKSSSTFNTKDMSKLPNPDSYKSPGTTSSSTAARTVPFTKRIKVNSSPINKKEAVGELSAEGNLQGETLRQSKGSVIPVDSSLVLKNTVASASKHKSGDSKENGLCPSKTSSAENSASSSGSGRIGGPLQTQSTLVQDKLVNSTSGSKSTRKTSPIYRTSSRLTNHPTAMHPPIPPSFVNTTSTLSDEELAKRLHHELNSSPRVSRVPRGLHASGVQFASSTSASMLSKRSSSSTSGGKLQVLHDSKVSRRRNKEDAGKDVTRFHEALNKAGKVDGLPFDAHEKSSETESFRITDSIKNDGHKGTLNLVKDSNQLATIAVDGSGSLFRTLPGLIDEIMSEGRHMTYEELCDAILPHWSSLRNPNGEQYAYASHSLAVLDCLRNRNEWAHLVDREPKTYSSKKRSKSNTPLMTEGSELGKAKGAPMGQKDMNEAHAHREHLPTKGKRLARKRRKLMLRGRAVQANRGREISNVSDDDLQSLSGEGSQSFSSKEEIHGSRRLKSTGGMSDSSQEESD